MKLIKDKEYNLIIKNFITNKPMIVKNFKYGGIIEDYPDLICDCCGRKNGKYYFYQGESSDNPEYNLTIGSSCVKKAVMPAE